jgi:CheY-like chemotaxis protein
MWVLQIDDDEDDLEMFSAAMELFDPAIQYKGVDSLKEALLLFADVECQIPQVIFLDINMPGHSGYDCYSTFKNDKRFLNTQFIFLSTSINETQIPTGMAFMKKQHSLKEYVVLLQRHLMRPTTYQYTPCQSLLKISKVELGHLSIENIFTVLKPNQRHV